MTALQGSASRMRAALQSASTTVHALCDWELFEKLPSGRAQGCLCLACCSCCGVKSASSAAWSRVSKEQLHMLSCMHMRDVTSRMGTFCMVTTHINSFAAVRTWSQKISRCSAYATQAVTDGTLCATPGTLSTYRFPCLPTISVDDK